MSSGGGGGGATTTSGIAPEFKPQLTRAVDLATANLEREIGSPNQIVADTSQLQPGWQAQQQVSQDALKGIDQAALQRQLLNTQGALQTQSQGNLGSARQQRANAAALADQAVQLQQADLQQRAQGAAGLSNLGQERRGIQQQALDAPHTALQRYFGYLGNVGQQQQSSQSGGGK